MPTAIICIDDEYKILQSLGEQLKRRFGNDYMVELARSGTDAIALCKELSDENIEIALIISDQHMAGMDGDELLIHLHQSYPQALKIMLTGGANINTIGNIVNNDALYRFISKPWDTTDLLMTVAEALRRYKQDALLTTQTESLKWTNTKLENSLSLLLATLDATADAILVLGQTGKVMIYNQQFTRLWGIQADDVNMMRPNLIPRLIQQVQTRDQPKLEALLQGQSKTQGDFSLLDHRVLEFYANPQQLAGSSVGVVISFRDVTQHKQSEAFIKQQAFQDSLTQLPNRLQFKSLLTQCLQRNHDRSVAVLFLDLDQFKQVNDSFGHAAGDLLLQQAVERLNRCLRGNDCLARWGGDEFVLLLPHVRTKKDIDNIATRLLQTLQTPFALKEGLAEVTTSIGIAISHLDGNDPDILLHHADLALYEAKQSGKNTHRYFSEINAGQQPQMSPKVPTLCP